MNNNGDNPHRQPPPVAPPGHFSHHLPPASQRNANHQDPQLAFLLANASAAAARGQQPGGGPGPHAMGVGNSNNGGGFVPPGPFGDGNQHRGNPIGAPAPPSSAAAAQLFEEQILQRASALRAEALMQQQQQQQSQPPPPGLTQQPHPLASIHTQQHQAHQIQAALQALHQQQVLTPQQQLALTSLNAAAADPTNGSKPPPPDPHLLAQQQQEAALLARAAALRDLGLGAASGPSPGALYGGGAPPPPGNPALDHLREQLDLTALMRQRQQQQQQQPPQPPPSSQPPPAPPPPQAPRNPEELVRPSFDQVVEQELERVRRVQQRAGMPPQSYEAAPGGEAARVKTESSGMVATQKKHPEALESNSRKAAAAPEKRPPPPPVNGGGKPSATAAKDKLLEPESAGAAAAAGAAGVRCKTKEELRKTPGTVIVPCRARGMPMDHNFISAYFVISEDAKHGENLVCSYYACRNGGIKFRYCAYCMAPVAKRNFSRRHDHGMSKKKKAEAAAAAAAKLSSEGGEKDVPMKADDDTLDESVNTGSDTNATATHPSPVVVPSPAPKKRPQEVTVDGGQKRPKLEEEKKPTVVEEPESVNDAKDAGGKDVSAKRRSMWNNLLTQRPRTKDPKDLSSWLNEVLAVSDPDFPLHEVGNDLNHPFGRVLSNELMKLSTPAATSTEDKAGDSGGAVTGTNGISATRNSGTDGSSNSSNEMDTSNNSADNVVGNEKKAETETKAKVKTEETKPTSSEEEPTKNETKTTVANHKISSGSNKEGSGISSETKAKPTPPEKLPPPKKKEDEGFAGSFADWRDRKKGKSLKKGSGSLRK